jgi:hypothetical protein
VGGANVDGVSIAVEKGRTLSFILKSTQRTADAGCKASGTLSLMQLEDWASHLERSGEVNFVTAQKIEQIAPAKYMVSVTGLGESCYQPAPMILDLTGGAPASPVTVVVASAGAIHGKLIGTAKPGEFAVALVAVDAHAGSQPVQVVFPDGQGRFAFPSLRPGPYRIGAQPAGESSKARWVREGARMMEIRIAAGAPTEMELPAPPPVKELP